MKVSIVLPAKNEAASLVKLLPVLRARYSSYEIIVVNDGSSDETDAICAECGVIVVNHLHSLGNGAAIKSGAREVSGDAIVFMDADGQHDPADVKRLVDELELGYDMVVGARSKTGQASIFRWLANSFYNKLASYITGQKVMDLTSGFRIVKAEKFRGILSLLPNGFSYPTTSTMAFFRSGYQVGYLGIDVAAREGKSHISLTRDGVRFLLIIFKIATLYSPLKVFLPASLLFFITATGYYYYTFVEMHRFTNMSALLYCTSVIVFLIGLVSEQISSLMYQKSSNEDR